MDEQTEEDRDAKVPEHARNKESGQFDAEEGRRKRGVQSIKLKVHLFLLEHSLIHSHSYDF